ncbi:MAG: redoxin [Flavobacteriaceae bacterium]|nr:redoxin [Flavobacteriaceae bacterium]
MKYFFALLITFLLMSCSSKETPIQPGSWKGVLLLDGGREIPFLAEWGADTTLTVINAEERILIDDIRISGDSVVIKHPVFEGEIRGAHRNDSIIGTFSIESLQRSIPVVMTYGRHSRFAISEAPSVVLSGVWETVFSPNSNTDSYVAKGVFDQTGNRITGTFETVTGDYRFLDGVVVNDSVKLSTFDFSHAFLFEASVTDSVLTGTFYSGNHWTEPFRSERNEAYKLPDPDSITKLKEEYARVQFAFPNTAGDTVSLDDARFQNKAVIVQIMGSWCPNCLDETRFLTDYYENRPKNVEIVALAFEDAATRAKAMARINRLKEALEIPYPILLAQYGSSDKQLANSKLPMLTTIKSYPTTIFIAPNGKVTRIHTGFNGPATGKKYEKFKKDFKKYVEEMVSDK